MITLDELKMDLNEVKKELSGLKAALNMDSLNSKKAELLKQQEQEGFWEDMKKAGLVNKEIASINNKLDKYLKLEQRVNDTQDLIDLSKDSNSSSEFISSDKSIKS